ncbi:MAG: peptide chain release factor N(5)-glutamine methyltransferase [Erysipelotrichia bacterium]|nr:peptide chain release factor N(5)-glutamine methyltransferase [Erysipelotrichia bacterium]
MTSTIGEVYEETLRLIPTLKSYEIAIRELICYIHNFDDMSHFYLQKHQKFADLDTFRAYLARFLNGEPIQYLTKRSYFLGENFYVDNRVLIPRMETEEVAQFAIKKTKEIFGNDNINIADIGTGSGVIALSLKRHFINAQVFASDISNDALDVAKINATKHKLDVDFFHGENLIPFIAKRKNINLIISNPPYIESKLDLEKSVLGYEPKQALIVNKDNSVYEEILKNHHLVFDEKLLIIFEIGENMKKEIISLINKYTPNAQYEIIKDINKKDRIVSILITEDKMDL